VPTSKPSRQSLTTQHNWAHARGEHDNLDYGELQGVFQQGFCRQNMQELPRL